MTSRSGLTARTVVITDQWRRTHLPSVTGAARRLLGSAADNASRSLEDLAASIEERNRLTAVPDDARPGDLVVLSPETCTELLASRTVGRLAYVARAGVPDVVPVNYCLSHGAVLIRSGPGPTLQAAERRELVAFEVDDLDDLTRSGWSVVVHGRIERLTAAQAGRLDLPAPWASGPRRHVMRIQPRRTTGRRLL